MVELFNNMQIKLQQHYIQFAFHPGKQSFLGINYIELMAKNCIYISHTLNAICLPDKATALYKPTQTELYIDNK